MTFLINHVVLAGKISDYGVKLSYLPSGKPEMTFSLILEKPGLEGKVYKTFVPIQVYGAQTEHLAETLEPGDLVMVDGQLAHKMTHHVGGAREDKRPAQLAVTCFGVEVLQRSAVENSTKSV